MQAKWGNSSQQHPCGNLARVGVGKARNFLLKTMNSVRFFLLSLLTVVEWKLWISCTVLEDIVGFEFIFLLNSLVYQVVYDQCYAI